MFPTRKPPQVFGEVTRTPPAAEAPSCWMHAGRLDEALSENKRAVELDPLFPVTNRAVGGVLMVQRKYDHTTAWALAL